MLLGGSCAFEESVCACVRARVTSSSSRFEFVLAFFDFEVLSLFDIR